MTYLPGFDIFSYKFVLLDLARLERLDRYFIKYCQAIYRVLSTLVLAPTCYWQVNYGLFLGRKALKHTHRALDLARLTC